MTRSGEAPPPPPGHPQRALSAATALNRRVFLAIAAATYAGVFATVVFVETPGLGLGHFLYIPICLVALVSDEVRGALAGVLAAGLYLLAIELTPRVPTPTALTSATGIRLVTFALIGALIGFYASRNRQLVERLRDNAGRDFLTGLGNARAFDEELGRRCAAGRPFSLILCDADDLKGLNDVHGHAAGNTALRRIGEVLKQYADAEDFVARIGGDEFAILSALPPDQVAALTSRVNRALSTESLSVTFGSTHNPDDGETAAELFHKADDRLFAGKLVRRNRATVVALAEAR
jgi:diguanylate cyclase (GGDEF)-like protein